MSNSIEDDDLWESDAIWESDEVWESDALWEGEDLEPPSERRTEDEIED